MQSKGSLGFFLSKSQGQILGCNRFDFIQLIWFFSTVWVIPSIPSLLIQYSFPHWFFYLITSLYWFFCLVSLLPLCSSIWLLLSIGSSIQLFLYMDSSIQLFLFGFFFFYFVWFNFSPWIFLLSLLVSLFRFFICFSSLWLLLLLLWLFLLVVFSVGYDISWFGLKTYFHG